mgnify:CR=1 FL=1
MNKIISKINADYYTWGEQCDGWYLCKNEKLHVIQERMPCGTGEKMHYHHYSTQVFYILSGNALFIIDQQEYRVSAGQSIRIEPGQIHCIQNQDDQDLNFLVISVPPSQTDRVNI